MEKKIKKIDWARLAAYIDGEGSISIDVQAPSDGNKFNPRHVLEVRVYNCDPRLLIWCKETFTGGNLKPVRNKNAKPHWNQEHVWYATATKAEWVLKNCLPYFIVKRERAELGLAFRILKGTHGKRVTPELFAKREFCHRQMKVLNQRGRRPEILATGIVQ